MNTLVVFSACLAAASAGLIASPYAGLAGLPLAGLNYGALPYAAGLPYSGLPLRYAAGAAIAPAAIAPAAVAPAVPAPIAAPSSQFQAQDEFGNINYGYSNINSAKQEVGNTYGGVTGSYSYVDANGIPQRTDYIADALGFRVKATNLPVAPLAVAGPLPVAPTYSGVAPEPVQDTPEVAAAKAEFQAAFDAAANREKRSADAEPIFPYSALPYAGAWNYASAYGLPYAGAWPYATAYGLPWAYNSALAPAAVAPAATVAAAPAAREAILTKIKLNPGHALAYRVD